MLVSCQVVIKKKGLEFLDILVPLSFASGPKYISDNSFYHAFLIKFKVTIGND